MHRDRAVASISLEQPAGRIKGRREGRAIRILERAHETIVGTLQRSRNFYYVVPDDPRFVHDIYVRPVAAVQGDRGADNHGPVWGKSMGRRRGSANAPAKPRGGILRWLRPPAAPTRGGR